MMPVDELQTLRDACRGLLYPSESDEPIEVFSWPTKEPTAISAVTAHAGVGKNAKIEEVKLDDFFRELESSDDGQRFKALHQVLLNTLSDVRVLRFGEVEVQIYLIGRTRSGLWSGLHTTSVET